MDELYRVLNRLKSYGMKGWHQTKEEWLIQRIEGENIDSLVKYLQMFLVMKPLDRRGFNLETVITVAINASRSEQEHLRRIYNACIREQTSV